jgi:hypothetical protein
VSYQFLKTFRCQVGVLVGPPLFDALLAQFGNSALTIQGVNNYAASVPGYLTGGDATGSTEMLVYKAFHVPNKWNTDFLSVGLDKLRR